MVEDWKCQLSLFATSLLILVKYQTLIRKYQQVEVEVVRSLQTAAGKMMFARRVGSSSTPDKSAEKPKPQGRKPQIAAPATTSVRQPRAPKLQQQASSATHLPQTTRRPGATAYHKPKHAVQPNNRSRRAADREAAFVDLANR